MSKKPAPQDWHKADIKAALEKKGWTFCSLSKSLGYKRDGLRNCLHVPAPKAERIVAETIGLPAQSIWPSRYHPDGTPKSGRGERGRGRFKAKYKFNGSSTDGNVDLTKEQST